MTNEALIAGCLKYDRDSQRALYDLYFGEMLNLCTRYAKNQQEVKDILLEGFKNLFNAFEILFAENSKKEKEATVSLQKVVKKEIISAAIRHMHSNKQQHFVSSTVSVRDAEKDASAEVTDEQILKSVNFNIIIKALQQLTPSYRTIFNLHEIDGFSYSEISKLLDISEYTAQDSFSKAKYNIRKNIARLIKSQSSKN